MTGAALRAVPSVMGPRRTVLVFRKDILPLSETFIRDQVAAYSEWHPVIAGFRRVAGLTFDGQDLVLLARGDRLDLIRLKAAQHGQYFGLFSKSLERLIRGVAPDLIHAHFGYDAILVSDIARKLQVPLVVTLHGTDILTSDAVWHSGREGWFFKRYPAKLRQLFGDPNTHFVAVSRAIRDGAIARGAPRERTHVFHTGVDADRFMPSGRSHRERCGILFVGRLVEVKGCEYLIRAMSAFPAEMRNYPLIVVGDGPLRKQLEHLARELGVRAEFRGALPQSKICDLMGCAAVFCLPSVTDAAGCFEAFGMVLLEAQASGLPVVTSARGGQDAVEDKQTGYFIPERDVQQLNQRLQSLIRDTEIWTRFSEAGRESAKRHFSIGRCTQRLESYYDRVIQSS